MVNYTILVRISGYSHTSKKKRTAVATADPVWHTNGYFTDDWWIVGELLLPQISQFALQNCKDGFNIFLTKG